MPNSHAAHDVNPGQILGMMTAFEQTAALRAAVRLDLFTAIADGATSAAALAAKAKADERGVAVLCDYLTIAGLLQKQDGRYALSPAADMFLNAHSPASMAPASAWHEQISLRFTAEQLYQAVRRGGADAATGVTDAPAEMWVLFARSMGVMAKMPAQLMAAGVAAPALAGVAQPKVLDIAGGHGFYGIAVARAVPKAEITLVDAAPVAEVAKANAAEAGVASRYHTLSGNVLPGGEDEVVLPGGVHLALITGFLHMFGPNTIEALFGKVKKVLAPGGAVLVVDFLPNEDRVSPPFEAAFSLTMLAATQEGRAYTEAEYRRMFAAAGLKQVERHALGDLSQSVLVARA
ncbi:MAG: class I SAM-dependent methyltransferase [Terriglobales bacterium]